ncbi:MAG: SRPBCC family protein [Bacteroidales bacterium]
MKIRISTPVQGNYLTVFRQFDEKLLNYLKPSFPAAQIMAFEGSSKGSKVHISLSFLFFSQDWVSVITEENIEESAAYFIDEGVQLPFFLSKWKHQHLVEKQGENAVIHDIIEFKTPFFLFDYLMYPALYLQFYQRKPKYQRFFGKAAP